MEIPTHKPGFVAEMKQRLISEKERLQADLDKIARREEGNDYEANYPDYGRDEEDNATEVGDYIAATATTEAYERQLEEVEAALRRIESGTYGVTQDGRVIPEERLRANPAANTIVEDELKK